MSPDLDPFWASVDASLDEIEKVQPTTPAAVVEILNRYHAPSSGDAFFPGSGGDRQLFASLEAAGWRVTFLEYDYAWTAKHPNGARGESLEYVEGDLYAHPRTR